MISKWKINLIAFLISLTLFGVGFSSWSITANSVTKTGDGTITVDSVERPVAEAGDMLYFERAISDSPFTFFSFDENGFVDSEGNHVTTATVSAYFYLDVRSSDSNLSKHFSNADSLYFEVTLTPYNTTNGANPFDSCSPANPSAYYVGLNNNVAEIEDDDTGISIPSSSTKNGVYELSIKLDKVLSSSFKIDSIAVSYLYFRVDFTFDVGSNYASFYNAINNENFKFGFSAKVSGYVSETGS